ncbi:MAG: hypothetical protein JNK85_05505 [Verrucomicrobiales bacterium]|nr:hypothetical protein [Verrucomicrobiales bacterium]
MEEADYRIRLDVENRVPPKLDQVVKGLNKVERAAESAGRKVSALERVLGKLLPGGGLGNALGDTVGGGVGATAGVGTAFFSATWVKGLIEEARAMDLVGKSVEESMQRMTRWSDGAIEGLSSLSYHIETLWRVFRKSEGERAGNAVNLGKFAGGIVGASMMDKPLVRLMTPDFIRNWIQEHGTDLAAQGYNGLTGGSGAQEVAAAEARLRKARENRPQKRRAAPGASSSVDIPNVDDLARLGLFRAGTPMLQSQMTELQRATNEKLDLMNRKIEDLAPRIAQHL